MGIFEVVFPTDFVRRITKHRRRDFAATVGAIGFIISTHEIDRIKFIRTHIILFPIGGTIGLFTGMSILSWFEVVYWIGMAAFAWWNAGQPTKREKRKSSSGNRSKMEARRPNQ